MNIFRSTQPGVALAVVVGIWLAACGAWYAAGRSLIAASQAQVLKAPSTSLSFLPSVTAAVDGEADKLVEMLRPLYPDLRFEVSGSKLRVVVPLEASYVELMALLGTLNLQSAGQRFLKTEAICIGQCDGQFGLVEFSLVDFRYVVG